MYENHKIQFKLIAWLSSTWLLACMRSGLLGCLAGWHVAQVAGWLDRTALDPQWQWWRQSGTAQSGDCAGAAHLRKSSLSLTCPRRPSPCRPAFTATGWKPEPSSTGWTPELSFNATGWKPEPSSTGWTPELSFSASGWKPDLHWLDA